MAKSKTDKEVVELQEKIKEAESRAASHMSDRAAAERKAREAKREAESLKTQLVKLLTS